MSTIKQLEGWAGWGQAMALAHQHGQSVLASRTLRVEQVDPLAFFAAGADARGGERGVFADPDGSLILVGVGVCDRIESQDRSRGRFAEVEREWRRRLDRLVTEGPQIRGTGPLLMGGFSFDPEQSGTEPWNAYASASFVLPAFLLTVRPDGCWLTVNRWVSPGENGEETAREWEREQAELLKSARRVRHWEWPAEWETEEVAPLHWKETVRRSAADIRQNALRKVVLARQLRLKASRPFVPEPTLAHLHREQSNSYLFAFERGSACFMGASPERLVKREGDRLYSTCIAGTIRRSGDQEEDRRLGAQLLHDPKNREEHAVVVDMIRAAFQQECRTIEIPEAPSLYTVRNMHHLYTPVTGHARPGSSLLSVVGGMHPTPAVGGFPQADAVAMIREREGMDRGWYASPVGWIDQRGDGEFVVAIRSGLLREETAILFSGCGIVGDSDPDSEYEETRIKFQPMLSALKGAGEG
ncbi:isochorismate synthase [Desmospora profundinema]|uniref:isochorismate synthase n=1 Tax=Desmospora profundinema TaxID=1571184 RepID=A0ABU1IQA3_9BACL|nr:isochorismate synthase [Desmospora profundinema]MDR6226717.1 menaquinone-specific isochorismate synthase [Desmospora profundinema]